MHGETEVTLSLCCLIAAIRDSHCASVGTVPSRFDASSQIMNERSGLFLDSATLLSASSSVASRLAPPGDGGGWAHWAV